MADEPLNRGEVSLARLFPSVRLLQAVGVSLQFKKLYLAAIGILVLELGWGLLDRLHPDAPALGRRLEAISVRGRNSSLYDFEVGALWRLTEPARAVIGPFLEVFSYSERAGHAIHAFLGAVWALIVLGIVGGAIARIATVRVAAGGRIGLREALVFAFRKVIPLVAGPLSPLFGVGLFAAGCALFGLLYRATAVAGPTIAGVLLVVPLVAGLVMATILVGLAAGWPLVHAAVAAEAEDGFDALSRSYAYVFQRPGRYLAYVVVAWVIGTAGIAFVDLFSRLVIALAAWGLSFTAPVGVLKGFLDASGSRPGSPAMAAHAFWLALVTLLVRSWTYAYFWTSASLIYLLLRLDVDGTEFQQVALPARPGLSHGPHVEVGEVKPAAPTAAEE